MIEIIITSSVLILVITAMRFILKGKVSLRLQYTLWLLVAIRLLIPFSLFNSPVSVMNVVPGFGASASVVHDNNSLSTVSYEPDVSGKAEVSQQNTTGTAAESKQENAGTALESQQGDKKTDVVSQQENIGAAAGIAASQQDVNTENDALPASRVSPVTVGGILRIVWYIGIAICALCFMASNFVFYRRLKKTIKPVEVADCPLPVYRADGLPSPCLFGLLRPAIYLTPKSFASEERLHHILAHELTHKRHLDHIWSFVRGLCLVVYWFNPLVWMAAILSKRDSELACDETTIALLGEENRLKYGRTLVGMMAVQHKPMDLFCGATTMTGGKRSLKERISLIAKKPKMAIYTLISVLLVAAITIGCTFTGAAQNEENIILLTEQEIAAFNELFTTTYTDEQGITNATVISCFFTSSYDRPEDINLVKFLRNCPLREEISENAEFEALKATEAWPYYIGITREEMTLPVYKYPAEKVNRSLTEYAGITLDDLSGVGGENLIYLDEYDAYYNFASNFAAGTFICTHGERQGDVIRLYADDALLTLRETDDGDYHFISHQIIRDNDAIKIGFAAEDDIPDIVKSWATEQLKDEAFAFMDESGCTVLEAKVTGLYQFNTDTVNQTADLQLWHLQYSLLPENLDGITLAEGIELDDDGWLQFAYNRRTEWGTTREPYLLVVHNLETDEYQEISATDSGEIQLKYGTPKMLELYPNANTAAALELYNDWIGIEKPDDNIYNENLIYELFDSGGSMNVGLVLEGNKLYDTYVVKDRWYAERYDAVMSGYIWNLIEDAGTSDFTELWTDAPYSISISSEDSNTSLTFFADSDKVCYRSNRSVAWYTVTYKYKLITFREEGITSLAAEMRFEYDNLNVSYENIAFTFGATPQKAAEYFVDLYNARKLALPPGSEGNITDYRVLDWGVSEVSEDETAVVGWFRYAVMPENYDSPSLWAGNTEDGTGEYEGWLVMGREFVLKKQSDGRWHCIGLGTGGAQLPDVEVPPSSFEKMGATIYIDPVTDELLAQYASYHEYIQDAEGAELIISTDKEIKNVNILSVFIDSADDGISYRQEDMLASFDQLSPEKPLILKLNFYGIGATYAISYTDTNNIESCFIINQSGREPEEAPPYSLRGADFDRMNEVFVERWLGSD